MDGYGKEACPDGSEDGMLLDGSLAPDLKPLCYSPNNTALQSDYTHELSHSCTAAAVLLISMFTKCGVPP